MRSVLFVGTDNFYHSRFAELIFNHMAQQQQLPFHASSVGFFARKSKKDGFISPHILKYLEKFRFKIEVPSRRPKQLMGAHFMAADEIILLDKKEHQPIMEQHFYERIPHSTFWSFPDHTPEPPEQELSSLEEKVKELIEYLKKKA